MKKYVCNICGFEYDPAVGDPDNGIAPGTAFENLPADWVCPVCGVGKEDFSPAESGRIDSYLRRIADYLAESPFTPPA